MKISKAIIRPSTPPRKYPSHPPIAVMVAWIFAQSRSIEKSRILETSFVLSREKIGMKNPPWVDKADDSEKGFYIPTAIQSMARAVLKLPPTMIVAPVVVLLCTFRAPLSPDQFDPDVE